MKIFLSHLSSFRIRYSETDQMGFCYYGNYPAFLEVGRVEALRSCGIVYSELEKFGILLPVRDLVIHYKSPARYDQELTLNTELIDLGLASLEFSYVMTDADEKVIIKASTTLVFVDALSLKPIKAPEFVVNTLKKYVV